MSSVDVIPRSTDDYPAGTPPLLRTPLKAVKFLLPVWGYNYVRYFLEFCLPTLLAPGNVPAVVAALPSQFIILTSTEDAAYIRGHPAFKRLAAACETELRLIDHLIVDGNYSTTITLAFTEAVRAAGDATIDTCFMFLMSDFILADGSFANVLKRMQRGASAVITGNFQVVREDAMPWLLDRQASSKHSLVLPPRELMRWAMNHLHPATLANTVNIPFNHNWHANRLFWRIDGDTMLGRFYLMHVLCVRPEVTEFAIGSSFDYSFVPELCPSGNVEAIVDSDEFSVVEMQPEDHEAKFLRPGPIEPRQLSKSLSEWTTRDHRENARHTLIFHAADITPQFARVNDDAATFVSDIARRLTSTPMPHRGHPYWHGAMAAFRAAIGERLEGKTPRDALAVQGDSTIQQLLRVLKKLFFGQPPNVRPWHPYYPDYRTALNQLAPMRGSDQQLLLLSSADGAIAAALKRDETVYSRRCSQFMYDNWKERGSVPTFDGCLVELSESDANMLHELMVRIAPLMKGGAPIVISVFNQDLPFGTGHKIRKFARSVSNDASQLAGLGLIVEEELMVTAGRLRIMAFRGMLRLKRWLTRGTWIGLPIMAVAGMVLLNMSLAGNLGAMLGRRGTALRSDAVSSLLIRLKLDKI